MADFFDPSRLNALDRDLFLQIDYRKGAVHQLGVVADLTIPSAIVPLCYAR